jgi:hypothetical protein
VSVLASRAEAKQFHFDGPHPVDDKYGGGFCYIEGPHIHIYDAHDPDALYRVHDDNYVFVGDPVAHGYEGPKNAFYGPHPIPGPDGDEWCYIEGPHYHVYAAPPEAHFTVKNGVNFYVGELPQAYVVAKPRYTRINTIYRPMHYARPVFVEAPPPEYHGPIVDVEAGVVVPSVPSATVVVGSPQPVGAVIVPSTPTPVIGAGIDIHAGISVGVPTVVVPAPVVIAPAPVVVVHDHATVVQPVVVQPGVVVVHDHEHHDNGKHKGEDHQ